MERHNSPCKNGISLASLFEVLWQGWWWGEWRWIPL